MERIFLALTLPHETREALGVFMERWRRCTPGAVSVRWVPVNNLHVTLKFIGDVNRNLREDIVNRCESVFSGMTSIDSGLACTGMFPSIRNPRILWVGARDETGRIERLSGIIEDAVSECGIAREKRRFTPHITVARIKGTASLPDDFRRMFLKTRFDSLPGAVFDEICLFRSQLLPSGARYGVVKAWKLE